jgi:hypothetical protein
MQISMKYILFSLLLGIGLIIPQNSFAQTADAVCSGKKNGDACTFTTSVQSGRGGTSSGGTQSGFCDRTNGDSNAANNPLTCRAGDGWKDCVIVGDACLGNTSTTGQRGTSTTTGTCTQITGTGSSRSSGRTSLTCDTSKKPTNSPGGRAPDGSTSGGSTGGGTCQDCGGATCSAGQVCADKDGASQCVQDKGNTGKCGANSCSIGQVCIDKDGASQCVVNKCPGGGGAGNGGGGTTPPANTAPTDATAPQSVGFTNPIKFNSVPDLIAGIINALLGILGAITVAILVMSGFKYMTASNPGAVGQALDGITNAIVGLIIIMGAFLITQYVISALAA